MWHCVMSIVVAGHISYSVTPSLTQVVLFPLPPPVVPHVGVVQSQALLSHLPHQDVGVNLDTEYQHERGYDQV